MKALWSQWMSQLSQRVPERAILLVPGHFFYGHRFEVPTEMPLTEVRAFLELSLEGASPFPLEQLSWGYLYEPAHRHAYTFATSMARLRAHLGERPLESFHYALPGFLSQYGVTFTRPTVRFVAENGSLSAILYAAKDPLPVRVVSREIKGDVLTDALILTARDKLAHALPAEASGAEIESGVWVGDGHEIESDDRPTFFHRHITASRQAERTGHTLTIPTDALWTADLRNQAFEHKERRERKISHGLWTGAKIIGACALALAVLQIILLGLSVWRSVRESRVAEQAPAVSRIDQSEFLTIRLMESADQSLNPMRMLEIVNDVRPDPIFFTRTQSTHYNQLTIQGQSNQGIPAVNAYEQALRKLDAVRNVEQAARTSGGRTTFDMTVTFNDDALADDPEVPEEVSN